MRNEKCILIIDDKKLYVKRVTFDFRLRRSNAGYEEFEMPREGSKDNKGFEDERGYSRQDSFESLPEPERPPLRHIDTYCKPECPCLSKRYTIATLACIGEFLNMLVFFHFILSYLLTLQWCAKVT